MRIQHTLSAVLAGLLLPQPSPRPPWRRRTLGSGGGRPARRPACGGVWRRGQHPLRPLRGGRDHAQGGWGSLFPQ